MLNPHAVRFPASRSRFWAFALSGLLVGAWAGCRCAATQPATSSHAEPTLRLVLISGIAGAIEPCGCVEDMLGGVDHAAAYLKGQAGRPTLVLGAGPMLFADPVLPPARRTQDLWKAEALVSAMSQMGLRAWAPGANDFAAGVGELRRLVSQGPALLAANLPEAGAGVQPTALFRVNGTRVGVAGLSRPEHAGRLPDGLNAVPELERFRQSAAQLVAQGAELRVALVAMPRGEALRLAEQVPDFHVMLLGKPVDQGESSDPVTPPVQVGRTLVVESPNHLQAFYVLDLFVKNGRYEFQNADARREERAARERQIEELERRLRQARGMRQVAKADLQALERSLDQLKAERDQQRSDQATDSDASTYRVKLVTVREAHGADPAVQQQLSAYYRRVNQHNREALKDRMPPALAEGQRGYLGAEQCRICHAEEYAVWSKTGHAKAYQTLAVQHKEFNLDCVGCHVTGYEQPGGSSVTHVASLKDVQCEVCHGPGSAHLTNPADKTLLLPKPERGFCAECHHPPHVKPDWSVDRAWPLILGPGHGG